jgi:hypothetical protein
VDHVVRVAGGEGLPLSGADDIIWRGDHLREIGDPGQIIMEPLERGD